MKILIAGDLVPTQSNENYFITNDIENLIGKDLYKIWINSDCRIFNLETPLTNELNPLTKAGPNLYAKKETINGIVGLAPTVVCLANNHIMDQNEIGLNSTVNLLDSKKINYIGIGNNKNNLIKSYIIKGQAIKVGVYACCEKEFTGASTKKCGANLYDEFETFNDIKELRKKCDYVIVLYHGAKEYYRYPSPRIQKLCRCFVEAGASFVVCQHSHCIGCIEKYKKSSIIYGQGNFIFDRGNDEYWNSGLILSIDLEKDKQELNYYLIKKENEKIRLMNNGEEERKEILENFEKRNNEIKSDDFILEEYNKFAKENIINYLKITKNPNIFVRILNKIFHNKIVKKFYSKKRLLSLLNIIECEAHRELFIKGLRDYLDIERE